jgi:hypothetical protein
MKINKMSYIHFKIKIIFKISLINLSKLVIITHLFIRNKSLLFVNLIDCLLYHLANLIVMFVGYLDSGNGKNGFVEIPKQVSQQQTMEVIVTPPLPTNQVKSVEVGVQHLGSVPSNKQSNSGKSSEHPNIIQYPLQQQPNIQNEI